MGSELAAARTGPAQHRDAALLAETSAPSPHQAVSFISVVDVRSHLTQPDRD
jgi:hypothetical protein